MKKIKVNFDTMSKLHSVSKVQDFHVQKLSDGEAMTAYRHLNFSPCDSFEAALEQAGIAYDEQKQLKEKETYTGYIAVHIGISEIGIYRLCGSLSVIHDGTGYNLLAVRGNLFKTNSITYALSALVENHHLPKEAEDNILAQLREGNTEISVEEKWAELLTNYSHAIFEWCYE